MRYSIIFLIQRIDIYKEFQEQLSSHKLKKSSHEKQHFDVLDPGSPHSQHPQRRTRFNRVDELEFQVLLRN